MKQDKDGLWYKDEIKAVESKNTKIWFKHCSKSDFDGTEFERNVYRTYQGQKLICFNLDTNAQWRNKTLVKG